MQRYSLKILQKCDIRQGSEAHSETSLLASLLCMCWRTKIYCWCEFYLYGQVHTPHAVSYWRMSTFFWANFFYFISFHHTGVKNLFVCPPIYLVFHPPPLRICTVPFTWLRCGGILPNCCELNSALECSLGLMSSLTGKALGYARHVKFQIQTALF